MEVLQGKPIAPGYAKGKVYLHDADGPPAVPGYTIDDKNIDDEHSRFRRALGESERELNMMQEDVDSELGEEELQIFSAHLSLLKDEKFIENVKKRIKTELVNAEQAVSAEIDEMEKLLSDVENEYIRERISDIRDAGQRVLRHLTGDANMLSSLKPGSVVVAHELYPSDTLHLDRRNVAGFVTERGGTTTHAGILARSLGIPSVTGITGICGKVRNGMSVLVNGNSGSVILDPSEEKISVFKKRQDAYREESEAAIENEYKPAVTKDGVSVTIMGNINRPGEAEHVKNHKLDGAGLFRTEYLFLGTEKRPDIETQVKAYERAAHHLNGRPLVIRTLDLGGDKKPLFLTAEYEANPNLGLRGLRFSLYEKDMLKTQLRAILRVSRKQNVRLLFPMVIGSGDLEKAIAIVREIGEEEGTGTLPHMGAMMETPAALYQIEHILEQADFVSIGTNDLTRFILAADRYAVSMLDECSVLHPAVLSAVRDIVQECGKTGCPLTVCGESAGDPKTACFLVILGIRNISMSPESSPKVRQAVRRLDTEKWKKEAEHALDSGNIEKTRKKADEISEDVIVTETPVGKEEA